MFAVALALLILAIIGLTIAPALATTPFAVVLICLAVALTAVAELRK